MLTKKRILLIDDEESFCFFTKANLETEGNYSVTCATDPYWGIKFAQVYKPDLILLDIVMPEKDGFEVLRVLKRNERLHSIPVIMLTALDNDYIRLKSFKLYAENFIAKPVETIVLKAAIDKALGTANNKLPIQS